MYAGAGAGAGAYAYAGVYAGDLWWCAVPGSVWYYSYESAAQWHRGGNLRPYGDSKAYLRNTSVMRYNASGNGNKSKAGNGGVMSKDAKEMMTIFIKIPVSHHKALVESGGAGGEVFGGAGAFRY